jgi:predicted nucleotidyltransferase
MTNKEMLDAMRARMPVWCRDGFLAGYRGSQAHGTYVPPEDPKGLDDIDVFQIFIHRPIWYLSLDAYANVKGTGRHFATDGEELDIIAYEIQKFFYLLCKGNPNVHIFLWLRPIDYIISAGPALYLLKQRESFLSQRVLEAFAGYAMGQLKRMERFEYHGRMGAKRKALVDEHGYDCKNASHLIRLLRMGIEVAETGKLIVYRRDDAAMLRNIKTGGWTLDSVKEYADDLWASFESARKRNDFPPHVERADANKILLGCMERGGTLGWMTNCWKRWRSTSPKRRAVPC